MNVLIFTSLYISELATRLSQNLFINDYFILIGFFMLFINKIIAINKNNNLEVLA